VVFEQLAKPDEVERATGLFWEHMEREYPKVHRKNPISWSNDRWECLKTTTTGVVAGGGIGQSNFLWYLRGLPSVRKAFETVWEDDDLLVSYDGCGVFRPPEYDESWATRGGWFHVDQNGYSKKGRHCVQGLINLLPSGPNDGGLVVVPKSHILFEHLFATRDDICNRKGADFAKLDHLNLKEIWGGEYFPVKVCLDPGDFVMWDSRTTHCNHPATMLEKSAAGKKDPVLLRRLVAYICMTPTRLASNLKELRNSRVNAVHSGITTNHWPHEYHPHPTTKFAPKAERFIPPELTPEQKELVVGKSGPLFK